LNNKHTNGSNIDNYYVLFKNSYLKGDNQILKDIKRQQKIMTMEPQAQSIQIEKAIDLAFREEFLKSLRACIYAAVDNDIKKELIEILKKAS
jgi:hypothetical protein